MATLTDYKDLKVLSTQTGDVAITGDGGRAINDDFLKLADRAPMRSDSDPGADDDETEGYFAGSLWLNDTTQTMWSCTSATPTAAVWKSLFQRNTGTLVLCPEEDGTVLVNESLTIEEKSGQSDPLTVWKDSASDIVADVDGNGTFTTYSSGSDETQYGLEGISTDVSSYKIAAAVTGDENEVHVKKWDSGLSEDVIELNTPNSIILDAGSYLILSGLPTSDPSFAGALWNDSGTLKVSLG